MYIDYIKKISSDFNGTHEFIFQCCNPQDQFGDNEKNIKFWIDYPIFCVVCGHKMGVVGEPSNHLVCLSCGEKWTDFERFSVQAKLNALTLGWKVHYWYLRVDVCKDVPPMIKIFDLTEKSIICLN